MKRIGIFYGSTTGTCESLAQEIASKLNVSSEDVYNVADASSGDVQNYEVLLLGSSTWGDGDLQDDWYDMLDNLKNENLSGKTVCLFGCGDSATYSDTFCDALGHIYEGLKDTGCKFAGSVNPDAYNFGGSTAIINGDFIGLVLDDCNESNLNDERISKWVDSLQSVVA